VAGLAAARAWRVLGWAHSKETVAGINAHHVNPRYLTSYTLPANVTATTSLDEAARAVVEQLGDVAVILATPSSYVRTLTTEFCEALERALSQVDLAGGTLSQAANAKVFPGNVSGSEGSVPAVPTLVLSKGIEPGSGLLMTQVVEDASAAAACPVPLAVAALSGPNHAEEVCKGLPAAAVVATASDAAATAFTSLLLSPEFRVYTTGDLVGVEVPAALKNVIAIACGVAAGLGYGDNTLAVLMTRGLAEMCRLAVALGASPLTCMGLAGMGDLVATCTSEHSRNRTFGEALAAGESLSSYEARTHMVVEGARAAVSALEVAARVGVELPVTQAVAALLRGEALAPTIQALIERPPSQEFYGISQGTSGPVVH
jgi:glycerol-3-phosphate dehydrogenase (NAD(P)+)